MKSFQVEEHNVILGLVQGLALWLWSGSFFTALGYTAAFILLMSWGTQSK